MNFRERQLEISKIEKELGDKTYSLLFDLFNHFDTDFLLNQNIGTHERIIVMGISKDDEYINLDLHFQKDSSVINRDLEDIPVENMLIIIDKIIAKYNIEL